MSKLFLLLLVTSFFYVGTLRASQLSPLRETVAEATGLPMPAFQMPTLDRREIQKGLRLWVLEDHRLPSVEIFFQIPYGEFHDPESRFGRSSLMALAWRGGGTLRHSPDEFAALLAARAISIGIDIDDEYSVISLKCLKGDLSTALALFEEWFREPAFDAARFELGKRQIERGLGEIKDTGDQIARYLYPSLIYGEKSVWGRMFRSRDLAKLTLEDVKAAHADFLNSGPLLIGATGDIRPTALEPFLKRLFKDRNIPIQPSPSFVPMTEKQMKPGLTLVEKEGNQTTLVAGHLGERRGNPDRFALLLGNYILGGDPLSSLLATEIRTTRGLVYGIYSSYGVESDYGIFKIYGQMRADETAHVLKLVRSSLREFVSGKNLTEGSLEIAKRTFLSHLLFSNADKGELLQTLMRFDFYGYEENYLETFAKKIGAVTLPELKSAVKRYFFPDRLNILVVGPAAIKSQLGGLPSTQIQRAGDIAK